MINQVIHGDCFEVLKDIPDGSIDAVITDPPYKYLKHKLETDWDEKIFFTEVLRILKKDSFLIFFGRGESWFRWNYLCQELGLKFKEEIIWDKVRTSNPLCQMPRSHENIAIYVNGSRGLNKVRIDKIDYDLISNPKAIVNDFKRILSTIKLINSWEDFLLFKEGRLNKSEKTRFSGVTIQEGGIKDFNRGSETLKSHLVGRIMPSIFRCLNDYYGYVHPTQKPLFLIQKLIELVTNPGDLVLDPFAGSGTTALACKELGRNYICIEKEREYVDIIHQRLNTPITERGLTVEEQVEIEEKIKPGHQQLSLF
jgi:site-specific DNA-methyltransferase (adenine-specific)